MQEFDYVVVGGGSAGCVIASRLTEDPGVSVCLLEAGGPDSSVMVRAPLGFAAGAPIGLNTARYHTVPQAGLNGRLGFQPRGKVMGGSSSINAMVYIRGHRSDFDHWASLGNPGWDYASVLPLFKRSENSESVQDAEYRGQGGPLNICHLRSPSVLNEAFLAACEVSGVARTPDPNGAQQDGAWHSQVTQIHGERCNTARAFITPHLGRRNLTVITQAQVSKIDTKNGRATGVQFTVGKEKRTVLARKEIVLSAGAYGSPQLLMLSGIGRSADLAPLGIPVVRDLPGVGLNLQDHVNTTLIWRSSRKDAVMGLSLAGVWKIIQAIFEWRSQRTGLITSNAAEAGAFFRTQPHVHAPDIELQLVRGIVDDHNRKTHLGHGYSLHVTLVRPKSRGQVTLASTDPAQGLKIDPRYFSHPEDMVTLVSGTRRALQIMNAAPLAPFRGALMFPVDADDPADIERLIRRYGDTEYHPCGTCKMGPSTDAMAVVDAQLRVHGISGLRVADASVMPTLTTGNTNAATIMIGEKCADLIRAA